ncbi:MAG: Rieske 2Fe-2S domain-containing protein [Parvularculaceae bacterium]
MFTEFRFSDASAKDTSDVIDRALKGEVFVIRDALQHFGLLQPLIDAAYEGVRKSVGADAATRAKTDGFNHIHKWVEPTKIPAMTEAVYDEVRPLAPAFLRKFVGQAFPGADTLYYEETPNVRFHIPYDLAAAHNAEFREFAKDYGEGKIAAHGPHRDSWLDCPDNGVNMWFAVAPIRTGNGLTVYEQDYGRDFKHKWGGDVADGQKLHKPYTFDLNPGDCVLFHTDQMHGSELNRTDETRFAISFRMSFGKPNFPNRHFHRYVNANLAESPMRALAHVPAMVQPSYPRSMVRRIREKLGGPAPADKPAAAPEMIGVERDGKFHVALADIAIGEVRGVSPALCVARFADGEVIAVTRRCPHSGGDIANGWVDGDSVVCPWHNLPFSGKTGRSPCNSLPALRRVKCEVVGGEIVIDPKTQLTAEPELV